MLSGITHGSCILVSSGGCNEVGVEGFGGGGVVEGAAGAGVELVGDGVEVGLGVGGQVGAFGEVVADQAVGVFVGAALPGRMGVGEVDRDAGGDGELGVVGHFFALVPGQGAAQRLGEGGDVRGERGGDGLGGVAVGQGDDQAVAGGALGEGDHRGLVRGADDQVAFPVAGHGPV